MRWIILLLAVVISACGGGGGGSGGGPQPAQFVELTFSDQGCLLHSNEDVSYSLERGGVTVTHKIWGRVTHEEQQDRQVDIVFESEDECMKQASISDADGHQNVAAIKEPSNKSIEAKVEIYTSDGGPVPILFGLNEDYLDLSVIIQNTGSLPLYGMSAKVVLWEYTVTTEFQEQTHVARPKKSGLGGLLDDQWIISYAHQIGLAIPRGGFPPGRSYPLSVIVTDAYGVELGRAHAAATPNW